MHVCADRLKHFSKTVSGTPCGLRVASSVRRIASRMTARAHPEHLLAVRCLESFVDMQSCTCLTVRPVYAMCLLC
jgi:hypothetical protein